MDYESIMAEIRALKSFLEEGDYNDNKMIESLVVTMNEATADNFVNMFMAWVNTTFQQYRDKVQNRKLWRDKINELEAMLPVDDEEVLV